eukprot:gene25264-10916_t
MLPSTNDGSPSAATCTPTSPATSPASYLELLHDKVAVAGAASPVPESVLGFAGFARSKLLAELSGCWQPDERVICPAVSHVPGPSFLAISPSLPPFLIQKSALLLLLISWHPASALPRRNDPAPNRPRRKLAWRSTLPSTLSRPSPPPLPPHPPFREAEATCSSFTKALFNPGPSTTCFVFSSKSCEASSTCCNEPTVNLQQVDFELGSEECRGSVSNIFMGSGPQQPVYVDGAGGAPTVLRVDTSSLSTATNPTGAVFCINLSPSSACPRMVDFCGTDECKTKLVGAPTGDIQCTLLVPSANPNGDYPPLDNPPVVDAYNPPPTPPREGFPYASCDRFQSKSNYKLSSPTEGVDPRGMRMYCFDIELEINDGCYGSLAYTTVDGYQKAPFLQREPPSIRITRILKGANYANGTEICIILRPPCGDLPTLCAGSSCKYAIINDPRTPSPSRCCPVGDMPFV